VSVLKAFFCSVIRESGESTYQIYFRSMNEIKTTRNRANDNMRIRFVPALTNRFASLYFFLCFFSFSLRFVLESYVNLNATLDDFFSSSVPKLTEDRQW